MCMHCTKHPKQLENILFEDVLTYLYNLFLVQKNIPTQGIT